jgi:hypothetical protein
MKWNAGTTGEFNDPKTGNGYNVTYGTTLPTAAGQMRYAAGNICGTGGAMTTTGAGTRNVAASVFLEGSGVYCADNR